MRARARARLGAEDGSAVVEFIGWAVILLVPVVYLLVALAQVQAASFAVASAADAAARVLEADETPGSLEHAELAARLALEDQHVDVGTDHLVETQCEDARCTSVTVRVSAGVDLPLLSSAGIGHDIVTVDAVRLARSPEASS